MVRLLLESIIPNKTQHLSSINGSHEKANKENNKNNSTLIMVKRDSAITSLLYEVLPEQTSFVPSTHLHQET